MSNKVIVGELLADEIFGNWRIGILIGRVTSQEKEKFEINNEKETLYKVVWFKDETNQPCWYSYKTIEYLRKKLLIMLSKEI